MLLAFTDRSSFCWLVSTNAYAFYQLTFVLLEFTIKLDRKLSQMFVATRYVTNKRSSTNVCRYSICDSLKGRAQILRNSIYMEFLYY